MIAATREGFPVLDGVASFLRGAKCLLDYRDFSARAAWVCRSFRRPPWPLAARVSQVACKLDENEAMSCCGNSSCPPSVSHRRARIGGARGRARARLSRRAEDRDALDRPQVRPRRRESGHPGRGDLDRRLSGVLSRRSARGRCVAPMISTPGVEMLLGMVHDDQFGPVVVLGFGGLHVEASGGRGLCVAALRCRRSAPARGSPEARAVARAAPATSVRSRSMRSAGRPRIFRRWSPVWRSA